MGSVESKFQNTAFSFVDHVLALDEALNRLVDRIVALAVHSPAQAARVKSMMMCLVPAANALK
jgi:hypothetical protein